MLKKRQMFNKFPADEIRSTKIVFIFISWAPAHHIFTFNSRLLYDLKVSLSKSTWEVFHFQNHFVFIKVYAFVQQTVWTLCLKNVIFPFKIKIVKKPQTVLLQDAWFLSATARNSKIQWHPRELELHKIDLEKNVNFSQ